MHRCHITACLALLAIIIQIGSSGCECASKAGRASTLLAARAPQAPAVRPSALNHMVFFKLKNPADADELIADCNHDLGGLPMIMAYFCGKPIDTGQGARIDSNYDVGFYGGFAGEAEYKAYLGHPNHQAMVQKWQPRWESVRILDVADSTP